MEKRHNNIPLEKELADNLGKVAYSLDKAYMAQLCDDYHVIPFTNYIKAVKENQGELKIGSNVRALRIKRWVYDRDELIRDGFKNVLGLFSGGNHNVALIIRRTPEMVEMYFAVKNEKYPGAKPAQLSIDLLGNSLKGNFNGTTIEEVKTSSLERLVDFDDANSVSLLCGIPSEKSENYISQGIEKLLSGIVPVRNEESYTCIILNEPMSVADLRGVQTGYEGIASALAPFAGKQFQYGMSSTKTTGTTESTSKSTGTAHAKTSTHNLGTAISAGMNVGFSQSFGVNFSQSLGTHASLGVPGVGAGVSTNSTVGTSATTQFSTGFNVGISGNYGYSWGKSNTDSITDTFSTGKNESLAEGESESTTFSHKSYMVSDLLEKLEATIKRINESQATGLWRTAVYIISESRIVSTNAANFLNSIMQGETSYLEPPYIQTWYKNSQDKDFENIIQYICHLTHPLFETKATDHTRVLPTANVTTTELSNLLSFPRYSIQGLPVIQCARFGREPHSLREVKQDIHLGYAYHMHHVEDQRKIGLDKSNLTAHTFITGSTGAGKSNTIYQMINELCFNDQKPAKFLVIEPAKGEYKDVFGGRNDVSVYGTNPKKAPLLRLNPFSFPDDIHVLEHIDRLVEVFNACWPMYAAMPAVLKDAIEASYISCGWSLTQSTCATGQLPTFATVLQKIPEIMANSAYSKDAKGDYTGALVTRVKSLTNGINGQIFCSEDEIADKDLFDQNVIVDLSRIGSMETKALLMGILMIKLQEYRMAEAKGSNAELRHVTVLEEAHNLLRRTSAEQSQESSNLQGKSVEMLANAIAEMRTYGEGFIIADQAPGLLDLAVIRNTNTKIIMRLPDESDRYLVGKSAGLNDDQIVELSRLDVGVATVFQNHWLEPVLCKVDCFSDTRPFAYEPPKQSGSPDMEKLFTRILHDVKDGYELSDESVDKIKLWVDRLDTGTEARTLLYKALEGNSLSEREKGYLLYCLVKGKTLVTQAEKKSDLHLARAIVEQAAMDTLQVSAGIAEEIRKMVFWYAASQVEQDEIRHRNLMYYGGVK